VQTGLHCLKTSERKQHECIKIRKTILHVLVYGRASLVLLVHCLEKHTTLDFVVAVNDI